MAILLVLPVSCDLLTTAGPNDVKTWQTIFFDDFNRADGDLGSDYSVQIYGDGSASIENNQLKMEGDQFWAIRYNTEVLDQVIRVSVTVLARPESLHAAVSVSGKTRNLGNDWQQQELYSGALAFDTDSIYIAEMRGSTYTIVADQTFSTQFNRSYRLELTINNTEITLKVTDLQTGSEQSLTYTDIGTPLNGPIVSLNGRQETDEVVYFDDFRIEKFE